MRRIGFMGAAAFGFLAAGVCLSPAAAAAGEVIFKRVPPGAQTLNVDLVADVVFRTVDDRALALDIYRPKNASGSLPVVVLVHGGGWRGGDKKRFRREGAGLAQEGYAAVAVNYRLAPASTGMDMLDDVQCAIRWVRKMAGQYGFEPDRIGLVGGSAGAHLAALAATWPDRPCPEPALADYGATVTCVVDFFGPADFQTKEPPRFLRQLFAKDLERDPDFFAKFSPITHVSPQAPPFLILHGEADKTVPIRHSEALEKALREAGVEVEFIRYPHAPHAFINVRPLIDDPGATWPYIEAWDAAHRFLAKHLKPKK